jgi:hypothetical protein
MQGAQWTVPGRLRAALAAAVGVIILLVREKLPWPWLQDLLHEIGFALLVAVFIWVVFDYFSHTDEEGRWRTRIEQITSEVFYGVLRRNLPKELLAEANTLILNQVFIRKGLSVEYILEDDAYADGAGNQVRYTKLSAAIRYTLVNVSDTPKQFPVAVNVIVGWLGLRQAIHVLKVHPIERVVIAKRLGHAPLHAVDQRIQQKV